MSTRAQVTKAWRERNRSRGLCVGCTQKASEGFALCEQCRIARNEFQKDRMAKGMCFRCSNVAAPGRKKCLNCVLKVALYDLKRKGLPQNEINKASVAFEKYEGFCAACGEAIPIGNERFDHDDKNKKFRGIVHHGCNTTLGFCGENPSKLRKLADYLDTHARN